MARADAWRDGWEAALRRAPPRAERRIALALSLPKGAPVSEIYEVAGLVGTDVAANRIAGGIMDLEGHVNIEELYDAVRARDKNIGYATLYRTLKLLREVGIVSSTQFGEGPARYESNVARDHHDHLVCQRCGLIIEFENDEIERLQVLIAEQHGMRLVDHTMELYGVCKDREACDARRLAS